MFYVVNSVQNTKILSEDFYAITTIECSLFLDQIITLSKMSFYISIAR